ncbi:MAG: hypothetical protein V4495_25425 [Pseudomonadota bacterium]
MTRIVTILESNPADSRPLEALAVASGMTSRTAARLFVKEIGLTFALRTATWGGLTASSITHHRRKLLVIRIHTNFTFTQRQLFCLFMYALKGPLGPTIPEISLSNDQEI